MRQLTALLLLVVLTAHARGQETAHDDLVADLIGDLGSEDYEVRARATDRLWWCRTLEQDPRRPPMQLLERDRRKAEIEYWRALASTDRTSRIFHLRMSQAHFPLFPEVAVALAEEAATEDGEARGRDRRAGGFRAPVQGDADRELSGRDGEHGG